MPPDLTTFGGGTFGQGTFGRAEFASTQAPDVEKGRPLFRLRIYWDGDQATPVTYTDQPYASAEVTGEKPRVKSWGSTIRTAKQVRSVDTWRVTLVNTPDASGNRVSDEWSASDPPEGKLVVFDFKFESVGPGAWNTLFQGRISEVPRISGTEVDLIASTENQLFDRGVLPAITSADYPSAPDESLDRYIPLVLGDVPVVEGVLIDDAASFPLEFTINPIQTTGISFAGDPGFSTSGSITLGAEQISYTSLTVDFNPQFGITRTTLAGTVTRGAASTTAAAHIAGTTAIQVGAALKYAVNAAASVEIDSIQLIDSAGKIRALPVGMTPTIVLTAPSTIELPSQPVIESPGVAGSNGFKFFDLDTPDLTAPNTSSEFDAPNLEKMLGLADGYTDSNFVTLSATDPNVSRATAYRDAAIPIPAGASLVKAWVVVEHFLEGGLGASTTQLNGSITSSSTADILVDSITGFDPATQGPARIYVGEELIEYTGVTTLPSPRFTGITRGLNLIGALDHPDDTTVVQSSVEVSVRPDDGGANTVAIVDGEGFVQMKPTVPPVVAECSGLTAISKGFEDEHTHTVAGDHDHDTTTDHTHMAPTVIEWQPSLVQAREPFIASPGTTPCIPPRDPDWFDPDTLGGDYGQSVDGILSTFQAWMYSVLTPKLYGHWYIRSTSADLSPSDTRPVTRIEATIGTSWTPVVIPGEVTVLWQDTGSLCQIVGTPSATTVGGPTLNIQTGGTLPVEGTGDVLSFNMPIPQTPADYQANVNTTFVDEFSLDVSGMGLTVGDFVDEDFGGTTGKKVWVHWKAPNLEVHIVSFRLFVDEETESSSIPDPLEDVDWPDTESANPLKVSQLSWFDLDPKITSLTDLRNARVQVRHIQRAPYIHDALILRLFFVAEVTGVAVEGSTETPRRLICRVASSVGAGDGTYHTDRASTHIRDLFNNTALLNDGTLINDTSVQDVQGLVLPGHGVQYEQITYPELIWELCDGARLIPIWGTDGVLRLAYRTSRADLALTPVVRTFRDKDLVRTRAGVRIERAPLRDLITDVTVLAGYDPVSDSFTITANATSASAETAYGTSMPYEMKAPFVHDATAAADLADHIIDYRARLAERVVLDLHLADKSLAPDLADLIASHTSDYLSQVLFVERTVLSPGAADRNRPPVVSLTCQDMSP